MCLAGTKFPNDLYPDVAHLACHEGEDGDGSDGDVAGAAQEAVHEPAHKGGVEAVLRLQPGQPGIGNALRRKFKIGMGIQKSFPLFGRTRHLA